MALTISRVSSWIDRGRANLRVGYVDITFDGSPTAGAWDLENDEFSPGIALLKVFPEISINAGEAIAYDIDGESIIAVNADGTAVTDELDGVTSRFYYEGY